MDNILGILLGLAGAVLVKLSVNKDMSRWIRYPLIALVCLLFVTVITMVFYFGFALYSEEPLGSATLCLLGLFLLVGAVMYVRSLYRTK